MPHVFNMKGLSRQTKTSKLESSKSSDHTKQARGKKGFQWGRNVKIKVHIPPPNRHQNQGQFNEYGFPHTDIKVGQASCTDAASSEQMHYHGGRAGIRESARDKVSTISSRPTSLDTFAATVGFHMDRKQKNSSEKLKEKCSQVNSCCAEDTYITLKSKDHTAKGCNWHASNGHLSPRNIDMGGSHQTPSLGESQSSCELDFYSEKLIDIRRKSRSRTRQRSDHSADKIEQMNRSTSSSGIDVLPNQKELIQNERRSRSRSKSKDIIAIYTHRPSSAASRSCTSTPCGLTPRSSFLPRSHSVAQMQEWTAQSKGSEILINRSKSESRCSLAASDRMSLCSSSTVQSRCLSNNDIASENLKLWISTTSKNQRKIRTTKDNKKKEKPNFVHLEMDRGKNEAIEALLDSSNSVKPANIPMMMIAGHTPGQTWESNDEVCVKANAIVTGLYKQKEWLFIVTEDKTTGFVPFSYTKPIKTSLQTTGDSIGDDVLKPRLPQTKDKCVSSGILKSSKVQKHCQETTAPYRNNLRSSTQESVSSESSVFLEDIVYAMQPVPDMGAHADCLVVDTDDYMRMPFPQEEPGTYCSDSGISEPYSNHSDDVDVAIRRQASKERSPGVHVSIKQNGYHNNAKDMCTLPLGPLGQRLSRENKILHPVSLNQMRSPPAHISQDMRDRSRAAVTWPESLKPAIPKDYTGPRRTVMYDYRAENEDDLEVAAGDIVTVLNQEDREWIWVQRKDGREGFIPREYAYPAQNRSSSRTAIIVSL